MVGPDLIEKYKKIGKELWTRDGYRENQIEKIRTNWTKLEYREKIFNNSKQYYGVYNSIRYYSLVEFSFILYCEEKFIPIKNYDGIGIEYSFNSKNHRYYPDFIINKNQIIEVKGLGRWYNRDKEVVETKYLALKEYCEDNKLTCRLVFSSDIEKRLWKKAKKIHEQNSKENIQTV